MGRQTGCGMGSVAAHHRRVSPDAEHDSRFPVRSPGDLAHGTGRDGRSQPDRICVLHAGACDHRQGACLLEEELRPRDQDGAGRGFRARRAHATRFHEWPAGGSDLWAQRAGADPLPPALAGGAGRFLSRTASACGAGSAWYRGRICGCRPRSGRDRTPSRRSSAPAIRPSPRARCGRSR